MKTPSFWYKSQPTLCAKLLSPLSSLYAVGARIHRSHSTPARLNAPIICIGNLVAGGSGKTPTSIALMKILSDSHLFLSPAFVTRSYKSKIEGPERVDTQSNDIYWGDEATLLSRHGPTYIALNRFEGAEQAIFNGADVILLDDGLQNYSLEKDISFAVIDGQTGFGNGQVIPAGPLRQKLEDGLEMADAFILIGEDKTDVLSRIPANKPVFRANLEVRQPTELPNTPYIAFCGIGIPQKFHTTLTEKAKVECIGFHTFADHHVYTMDDMTRLVDEALEKKARLITTEKDYVRLPDFTKKSMIDVLPVEIIFENPQSLLDYVRSQTASSPSS